MTDAVRFRRIGIVSGVKEELAAFLPDVSRTEIETAGLSIQHLRHEGREIHLLCAGIGKVAAATAASLLHARFGVELLMVIGTAGKIAEIEGGLFNIVEAVQGDFGAQRAEGLVHYTAGSWPIGSAEVRHFKALAVPEFDVPCARIATSDLFIECGVHASRLRHALDVQLVDMETAAVAQAASLLGVPWVAIKATTDDADDASASSFVANLAAAARASAAAAERLINILR